VTRHGDPVKAYVTIIEGCNDHCAFCVVPYTRGHERTRAKADILADARKVGDAQIDRVKQEAEAERTRRLEETKRQIDAETKRSLDLIRSEVADLTLEATAIVVGRTLDAERDRELISEAIGSLDFSKLEDSR
jgi:tRNA A37 methylthiotransferase MiaB